MSEMTTYRWSFEEDVLNYRAAGIDGIGVWRHKLQEFGEERGEELLRESGMSVSSLSSAGGFTGTEGLSFCDAVDDAVDAVRLAAEIEAEALVVVSGSRGYHTRGHAMRLVRDALLELGEAGIYHGVQIAVQPMHRPHGSRWTFLNTLDATLDMLHRCDHPYVGMVFDMYHLWREPGLFLRMDEIVPWVKTVTLSDVNHVHSAEYDRVLPGQGIIPVAPLVHALQSAGYQGPLEMQMLSETAWKSTDDYPALLKDCQAAFQSVCPASVLCG